MLKKQMFAVIKSLNLKLSVYPMLFPAVFFVNVRKQIYRMSKELFGVVD